MSETQNPLEDLRLVWEPQLAELLGRSRYTLRRWVSKGIIPAPIKVTQQTRAWRTRDINAALDKLARSRKRVVHRGAVKAQIERADR